MIVVFFSIANIILAYLLAYRLSREKMSGIICAALLALLPLTVFFGRNFQPDTPALFFLMLFLYYISLWTEKNQIKFSLLAAFSLVFCGLFKLSFLIPALCAANFFNQENLLRILGKKKTLLGFLPLLLLPGFLLLIKNLNIYNTGSLISTGRINLLRVFQLSYWQKFSKILLSYVKDNYGLFLFILFMVALIYLLILVKKQRFFIILNLAGLIIYLMIFSDYFRQHSYYQLPFVFFFCFCIATFLQDIGQKLAKLGKKQFLTYLPPLILLIALPGFYSALQRQYDTQYWGIDVAGQSIQESTKENERFMFYAPAQARTAAFFAKRYAVSLPKTVKQIKQFEEGFKSNYLFIWEKHFPRLAREKNFSYIKENYHLYEKGFFLINHKPVPFYTILEKGGSLKNPSNVDKKDFELRAQYETSRWKKDFYRVRFK